MANIGKELEEIEVIPLNAPVEAPSEVPAAPAEPAVQPVPDRELVPASIAFNIGW